MCIVKMSEKCHWLAQLFSIECSFFDPVCFLLCMSQAFVGDFVPNASTFLMNGEPKIVKNCLLNTLWLQSLEKHIDCFAHGEGLMLASFKVNFWFTDI